MTQAITHAPFQEDQIASINAFQQSGRSHPLTCGNSNNGMLVAGKQGLTCPFCTSTQHPFPCLLFFGIMPTREGALPLDERPHVRRELSWPT